MKKLYFIVPIIGAVIFFFFYMGVRNDIKLQQEAREAQVIKERKEREDRDLEMRKRAHAEATEAALKRLAEREAKRVKDEAQSELVQKAKDERDLVYREKERQLKLSNTLTEDLRQANELLTKVKEQIKLQQLQVDYLKSTVKDVVQTKATYEQTLVQIEAAEKAAADAARQAAAAKKS